MDRIKRYAGVIIAAATVMTAAFAMPAGAVTLDWNDLTDAQQENAYKKLESENEDLKKRIEELEGQLGISGESSGESAMAQSGSADGSATDSASAQSGSGTGTNPDGSSGSAENTSTDDDTSAAAAEAQASAVRSIDSFLNDLAASFEARQEIARTHTTDEVSAMSDADMWAFRFQCAEAERSFYDSYSEAQFDDLNVFYLCSEYCLGLGKQFQAKEVWNSTGNGDEANKLYTAGYYNRAYALVELCEYYGLDLAEEYRNLKDAVRQMDALSGDETRNAAADPQDVMKVQELLNNIGFLCGTPDGIAGRQTTSCVERFQMMYRYEPADGIIDDELITQLTDILARKQG